MKKHKMSGKINLGCLCILIILVAGGYLGYKFGKVYLKKYLFNRKLFELAGDVGKDYNAKAFPSTSAIVTEIMKEADELSIGITYDDIRVVREDSLVSLNVTWEGDVDLPKYTHHFIFEFDIKRKVSY